MNYYVWLVTYGPYPDSEIPPKLISGPMTFEKAKAEIDKLGFGYCIEAGP